MTPLNEYYGLLDLMLLESDRGRGFQLANAQCRIEDHKGAGLFEAITTDFGISLVFPGWYSGKTTGTPVHIALVGDRLACLNWLPITPDQKREIIKRLPLSKIARTLLTLSV